MPSSDVSARGRHSMCLNGNYLETEPILDFFGTIALLVRRGALDKEIVRHPCFYWIDRYYEMSKDLIASRQQADPLVWKDLTAFVLKLRALQRTQMATSIYAPPSSEEIARFLAEEQTEADETAFSMRCMACACRAGGVAVVKRGN